MEKLVQIPQVRPFRPLLGRLAGGQQAEQNKETGFHGLKGKGRKLGLLRGDGCLQGFLLPLAFVLGDFGNHGGNVRHGGRVVFAGVADGGGCLGDRPLGFLAEGGKFGFQGIVGLALRRYLALRLFLGIGNDSVTVELCGLEFGTMPAGDFVDDFLEFKAVGRVGDLMLIEELD